MSYRVFTIRVNAPERHGANADHGTKCIQDTNVCRGKSHVLQKQRLITTDRSDKPIQTAESCHMQRLFTFFRNIDFHFLAYFLYITKYLFISSSLRIIFSFVRYVKRYSYDFLSLLYDSCSADTDALLLQVLVHLWLLRFSLLCIIHILCYRLGGFLYRIPLF